MAGDRETGGGESMEHGPGSDLHSAPAPYHSTNGDWVPIFLQALTEGKHILDAARAAHVTLATAYSRRAIDMKFAADWREAREIGLEELKLEAARRAFFGVKRPVFQRGKCVGYVHEYSDRLLMFLIKAQDPLFRDKVRLVEPVTAEQKRQRFLSLLQKAIAADQQPEIPAPDSTQPLNAPAVDGQPPAPDQSMPSDDAATAD